MLFFAQGREPLIPGSPSRPLWYRDELGNWWSRATGTPRSVGADTLQHEIAAQTQQYEVMRAEVGLTLDGPNNPLLEADIARYDPMLRIQCEIPSNVPGPSRQPVVETSRPPPPIINLTPLVSWPTQGPGSIGSGERLPLRGRPTRKLRVRLPSTDPSSSEDL